MCLQSTSQKKCKKIFEKGIDQSDFLCYHIAINGGKEMVKNMYSVSIASWKDGNMYGANNIDFNKQKNIATDRKQIERGMEQ